MGLEAEGFAKSHGLIMCELIAELAVGKVSALNELAELPALVHCVRQLDMGTSVRNIGSY